MLPTARQSTSRPRPGVATLVLPKNGQGVASWPPGALAAFGVLEVRLVNTGGYAVRAEILALEIHELTVPARASRTLIIGPMTGELVVLVTAGPGGGVVEIAAASTPRPRPRIVRGLYKRPIRDTRTREIQGVVETPVLVRISEAAR